VQRDKAELMTAVRLAFHADDKLFNKVHSQVLDDG